MQEIWKDVAGYEGLYQVSNLGRVKSLSKFHYCYSEDIVGRRKDRTLNKKMRSRLKRLSDKEIIGVSDDNKTTI